MNIFIDAISPIWAMVLFEDKKIIKQSELKILWSEFSSFLETFMEFLEENDKKIEDISWILVVNWPWWFTWTRIISLVVNTIQFVYWIPLESIDYFTLLEKLWFNYPIIIKANKKEYLIKNKISDEPKIVSIENIGPWEYAWIWDIKDFEDKKIFLNQVVQYNKLIEEYDFAWKMKRVEPFYIKRPNIT